MTVGRTLREPLEIHRLAAPAQMEARVSGLLDEVGLDAAFADGTRTSSRGANGSGWDRPRALVEPRFIVCDEPVSALDVSVQAQVLNLLADCNRNAASPTCSSRTTLPSSATSPIRLR